MDRFTERFAPCGLPDNAMTPVYGLAEATLGVAFTPIGRGPRVETVDADGIARAARAIPVSGGSPEQTRRFVSCGPPIPGFEVRIVDGRGIEVPERAEGAIEFRGPSTTSGYFRNPNATRSLFDGEWLRSGDRGYVAGGELYVTGRDKDLIVRAGRNLYPYDLEAAIGALDGVRKGCVAVFAAADPGAGTERLVVVAETREADPDRKRELMDAITRAATTLAGAGPDEIVLAPPHSVLKTSSGEDSAHGGPGAVRERGARQGGRIGTVAGRPSRGVRGRRGGEVVGAPCGARRLRDPCGNRGRDRPRAHLDCGRGRSRERAGAVASRAWPCATRVQGARNSNPGERRVEPCRCRAVRRRRQPCELPRRTGPLRRDAGPGRLRRQGRARTQRVPCADAACAGGGVHSPARPRTQRGRRRITGGSPAERRLAGLSFPRARCTACRACCRSGSGRSPWRWRPAPAWCR